MAKDYTSLLGKNSGTSWGEIAGAYFAGGRKKDNRARNVLLATLFFNAKEANMQSKVLKNLQENERQKTFDLAAVDNKWNKYNELITDDKNYQQDKNYFKLKAETEFSRLNPNFDLSTQEARDKRVQEINDYEKALLANHNQKLKTGNITDKTYLTKEEFYKPFEDYYFNKEKSVAAPKNVSLVHNLFDRIGIGGTDKIDQELTKEKRNIALRTTYDYLLDPVKIEGTAAIDLYRDPNQFKYNGTEASSFILKTYGDNPLSSNMINKIQSDIVTDSNKKYSVNDIKSLALVTKVNENKLKIASEIKNASEKFDALYVNRGQDIPSEELVNGKKTSERLNYELDKIDYIDLQTGLGDEDTVKARQLIRRIESEQDPQVKQILQSNLRNLQVGTVERLALSPALTALADPLQVARIQNKIDNGDYKDLNDWFNTTVSLTLDQLDNYFE